MGIETAFSKSVFPSLGATSIYISPSPPCLHSPCVFKKVVDGYQRWWNIRLIARIITIISIPTSGHSYTLRVTHVAQFGMWWGVLVLSPPSPLSLFLSLSLSYEEVWQTSCIHIKIQLTAEKHPWWHHWAADLIQPCSLLSPWTCCWWANDSSYCLRQFKMGVLILTTKHIIVYTPLSTVF